MKNSSYILLFLLIYSCVSKQKDSIDSQEEKPLLSVVNEHKSAENINLIFREDVADWKELYTVNSFLKRFKKTSPNEALSNALELRDLVKILKDSVYPSLFNIPSFDARLYVLQNETLRLADLTLIPAISAEEVNLQVDKTIAAFSSVNSKINTLLSKKRFEDAIDVDFDFIGIDSTKMDSISRNSISRKFDEEDELRTMKMEKQKRIRPKKKIRKKKQ